MFIGKDRFRDMAEGAILGLAAGDALGVPAECASRTELKSDPVRGMRGGGAHGQPAGTWSDDTSMTLCVAASLIEKGIDYEDQMRRFADWLWSASYTARGEVFDVGGTTKSAIFKFVKKTPPLECGEKADYTCGNGSLMRILPTALYIVGKYGNRRLDDRAAEIIHASSKCTHAHPRCQMACGVYSAAVFAMCGGGELSGAVKAGIASALSYYRGKPEFAGVYDDFEPLRGIEKRGETQISGDGYVLHTLQAALWCLLTTSGYAECVLKAVNLGDDADTTAAVAGGLAGLWYGAGSIPSDWAETVARYGDIKELAGRFCLACFETAPE
jgi:ADP-ribosyl-[dinitrogen reductase] hydrolase